jgi:hypothetical protein
LTDRAAGDGEFEARLSALRAAEGRRAQLGAAGTHPTSAQLKPKPSDEVNELTDTEVGRKRLWAASAAMIFGAALRIMPVLPPAQLEVFSTELILLQRRGLFHTAWAGEMLREPNGLSGRTAPSKRLCWRDELEGETAAPLVA